MSTIEERWLSVHFRENQATSITKLNDYNKCTPVYLFCHFGTALFANTNDADK